MIERKTTKQLLAQSFIELSQKQAIEKITVDDITNNCGLSRQTFYYYFEAKYDLVSWIFSEMANSILDSHITKEPWGTSLGRVLGLISAERIFYRKVMEKRDSDLFFSSFYEYCVSYYTRQLRELYQIETIDSELEFMIRFNCHGCTNITRDWLEGRIDDESPYSVGEQLYDSMPQGLKSYFTFEPREFYADRDPDQPYDKH